MKIVRTIVPILLAAGIAAYVSRHVKKEQVQDLIGKLKPNHA